MEFDVKTISELAEEVHPGQVFDAACPSSGSITWQIGDSMCGAFRHAISQRAFYFPVYGTDH